MAPREEPAHLQLQRSSISQRVQLTYKLFLLENARNTLEQELRRFANKPPVKNGVRTSQHQTLKDVLKFGPMLQSSLMASSVAKAVQVLGATLIQTELWDIGDIFTEVVRGDPLLSPLEGEDCQNVIAQAESSSVNIDLTTQIKEPEHENSSADAKVPKFNSMSIPEFNIRRFEEAEVVVSHIVSPGNFYIQHADSPEKLQALCTDSWKAGSSYAEQNRIPDIGTQVMGWFPQQEKWCRAQVMKICGVSRDKNAMCGAKGETSIKVEVKRLDHGDTACLSMWNMKELALEMALLPLQAVQVSLANVMPANGRDWSEEAVGWFKTMVHNRTLYARLYPQGSTVTVELFLEKGKLGAMRRGASLSLRLAQNGHAKHNKLKNAGLLKRSAVQLKMHKQDSDWEKYLISCYTQSKK
ncbi:tudor domain-containing protein 6-like [Brachyistius frenatus]|uniref:tudor domain-containing protein 6-like n=1 Tax=Brachyistius frenatus TaxID=100188 RepID=UPI0037E73B6C